MSTVDDLFNSAAATPNTSTVDSLFNTTGLRAAAERGGFMASAKKTVGQGIKGAGQLAADVIPGVSQDNPLTTYGQEVIEANPTVVNKLSDIPANPLTTVTEATGNAAPSVAGMLGIRALGQGITALSPLTGPAAPVVAGLGQAVSWLGPAAIAALPSYGGIRERQILDEPESQASAKDKAVAALGAATVGIIEQKFGPQNWALAAMTKEGRAALAKKFAATTLPGAIGKGVATGAAVEGAEEIVQNPVEQAASYQNPLSKENLQDTAFGGAMGAVGGGVLGGGFGGISHRSPKAKDSGQQRLLSNLIKGAQVSVANGVATVAEEGKLPVTMKVQDLAEHFAAGGTMATLTPEQRFGERGAQFRQPEDTARMEVGQDAAQGLFDWRQQTAESLQYNQERQKAGQGLRRTVPGQTPAEVSAAEAEFAQYQPEAPNADQGLRASAARRTMATELSPESTQILSEQQGAVDYTQDRNRPRGLVTPAKSEQQPAVSRVPGVAAEEVLAAEQAYRDYGPVITKNDGKPFATEAAAVAVIKSKGLPPESVKIQPVEGGFVAEPVSEESLAVMRKQYADYTKQTNFPDKPAKVETPKTESTGVKVRFEAEGAGPQVFEVVRQEPKQASDLEGEAFYTIVNQKTGETHVVEREDITPVKGQEEAFGKISNSVDKSSETQYSTTEGKGPEVGNFDFGEDTSEEAKKAIPVLRKVLIRSKTGAQEGSTITPRKVAGIVQSAADRIAAAFGRRVVFFASSDPAALLPNGFIDKNDPKTIYINTQSGFSPLTIFGHEILHAMKTENLALYRMLQAAALDNNLKVSAFEAYRERLSQSKYHKDKKLDRDYIVEEMIADFLGDTFADPKFWEQLSQERPPLFKRLSTYVITFLNNLITKLKGQKNFQSDQFFEDLQTMRDVAVKAVALYGGAEAFIGMEPMDVRFSELAKELGISVEEAQRQYEAVEKRYRGTDEWMKDPSGMPTKLNERQWVQVRTPAFKEWFGTSRAKTRAGEPEVFYHLSKQDISEFIPGGINPNWSGKAIWFGNEKWRSGLPAFGTNAAGGAPSTYSTFLRIEEPLSILSGEQLAQVRKDLGARPGSDFPLRITDAELEKLQDWGVDGIIISHDVFTADPSSKATSKPDEYIVFSPNQIKSAIGNTGQFAKDDDRISFSTADGALNLGRQKVTEAARSLANPKSRAHELYVQYAPQWLSVTPLITLVQTFGKHIQQVKDFARHIDGVVAAKNDIVNTSKELYDEAMELARGGPGEKAFNYAAGIASFNRMTPWLPLMEQDWVPKTGTPEERLKLANVAWKRAKMDEATGLKFHEAHKEAVKAYEALGSDEVKQAYNDIVGDLKNVKSREKNNLLVSIEQSIEAMWNGAGLQAATGKSFFEAIKNEEAVLAGLQDPKKKESFAKIKSTHTQLMERFNNTFGELQGAYWPLARVGDFILRFTDKDGAKVVKHYVTAKLRRLDKQQLIEDGYAQGAFNEDSKDKRTKTETAIPQELMTQLAGAVEAEYLKDVDMEDADAVSAARESAQGVVNDMNQIWLRWQPETSALKNSLRRKNTRGFDGDMMRSYLDYMSRHASNIAWTEQGRKIEQDIKSLADEIKKDQLTPGANTDMKRHILNDLRGRVQAIRDAKVGTVASGLGKLGTAYYMTSPSIALVQMTQLWVITLPKLMSMRKRDGSFVGWARASRAIAKATKQALTPNSKDGKAEVFTKDKIFNTPEVAEVFDNIRATVTSENRETPQAAGKPLGDMLYTKEEILKQIEKLTPYQQQLLALREATARNLLDISAAHETYELTAGKDPNGAPSKIFRYAMLPMQLSELASRKAAVLGTFDLAGQDKKNFFEAMNDVSAVVNDTLYSYAKEHKGSALQGGGARVLLQFQHYRIMTGIRLTQLFLNSVKGETPEVRAAARKEFIGIMGMAGALGGTMGLPMAGLTFALLNALVGDDDEPYDSELEWRNWLQSHLPKTLADIATTGLPGLLGMDVSRRVGMGDLFGVQQSPPPGTHGRQLFAWWAVSQLGPVASVGQSWFQGYDEFSKGNYLKSLEVSTPKPIRDALKAYRVGTEGLKTSAGKRLLSEESITADEVILMALGFNPEQVAKAQSAERSLGRMSTLISERRGKLVKQAARGILEGDTEEAMQEVLEFNKKMPLFAVKGGDIRSAVRKMITGEIGVTGPRDQAVAGQYEIPSYL